MPILLVHLSDIHLSSSEDPILTRAEALAATIASNVDNRVKECVIVFGGDAADRGTPLGFTLTKSFLNGLTSAIREKTSLTPKLFVIPGNHDHVLPEDTSLRDAAINSLNPEKSKNRPPKAVERAILSTLKKYFAMAKALTAGSSHSLNNPYYLAVDKQLDGRLIRFHLLNTAWMCRKDQPVGALLYPVNEIRPSQSDVQIEYEITILHHPFGWFRQPEAMRPLRDTVEGMSDLILTGHEHVGRSLTTRVRGASDYEYLEGESLQDGTDKSRSAFHLLRLDFEGEEQTLTTFVWQVAGISGAFQRLAEPIRSKLGRNLRRAARPYRLIPDFDHWLDDPELPVMHSKKGKLQLSDFYTFPDLGVMDETVERSARRIKGEHVVDRIGSSPRSLLLGQDRCGKTSLAKRLAAELHAQGQLPIVLDGSRLKNATVQRLGRLLAEQIQSQYEALSADAYWQQPAEKRIIIVDDFNKGASDKKRREELLGEIERNSDRVVLIASDEFCFDELFSGTTESRASNPLWKYKHYRILPFGYVRCETFIRRWVGLAENDDSAENETKVKEINSLLTQFLRNNPIPQHPWVVMVIVQQADSPEPAAAENGSYGYLLQALITAALAKSKMRLPVNGKYRWLGEFAHEIYQSDRPVLADADARRFHDKYRREYGIPSLDYIEIRDDLAAAGVLRVEGDEVSFRQPYTYCYFVAWHIAQRLNSGDEQARDEVKLLCNDLFHEETANVLVFLAHQTTSQIVLNEMTSRASEMFSDAKQSDLSSDVEKFNTLYGTVQKLVLPSADAKQNLLDLRDKQDARDADKASTEDPRREVTLKPKQTESQRQDEIARKMMEMTAAFRTIEILGQVLRNEATSRKVPEKVAITQEIFRLGMRLLGYVNSVASDRLEPLVNALGQHYRERMPQAKDDDLVNEIGRHIFNIYLFFAFAVVKQVAFAVGERNLTEVFRQILETDCTLANRIYKLAIDLEISEGQLPLKDAEILHEQLAGNTKMPDGTRVRNNFTQTLIRALVVDYCHLHHVPYKQLQVLSEKLDIEILPKSKDPSVKMLPRK